ncbi:PREDICTED: THAP domain-containing protein 1-like isoform X2 [Trachymyrmex cornetzi]|uniref:THAP domain-containing protein 5 n=1 Tax=Trachymyrmex cornetzi TaxID=471704 RepID=A0A195D9U0_9HYME|nr:PREDICTED: THAP domain-containing protein 1-like isoform X2 [Trachymyrmex cornetzi]KYN09627.1 THAP domain-containing protein 5 [Trachymyrmex cornetzi]
MRFKRFCAYCKRKRIRQSGYSFFKFPLDKSNLLKKWLDSMGIKNWTPDKSSVLCSDHFEQTCLRKVGEKYLTLKDGSIPTIFNKVDCFNNIIKSENIPLHKVTFDENLKQNQKIQFNSNKFDLPQKASCNKLSQTYSNDEDINRLLIFNKTEIVNLDHHYHISPSRLIEKLVKSQETLKKRRDKIQIQRQQLRRFKNCITSLKETIKELQCQRMMSEKCLNCMSMVISHRIPEYPDEIKSKNV